MPRFTPGELKVMRLLWEHGELKPSELQDRFSLPIKNPALRSYLTTLVEKGHVTRRRVGKAYYYKAVTPIALGIPDDAWRAG
jgi:BlaI family transcriptional regulator, penicillinase repressor